MVRLLHTADVHLSTDRPERQAALAELLDRAGTDDVDLVTIAGDLFDSDRDSEALRPELRQLFADRPYEVVAIPGNHDEAAFRTDLHFGESFGAAVGTPFEHRTVGDVRLTCVPYPATDVEDVLLALADREPYDGTEVAVLHCSLEAPFQHASAGDEAGRRYFPVTRETLGELGFSYYLAGHFHSAHRIELPGNATFVYPGSPASVTRKETGPRTVALLDTEAGNIDLPRLEAFHYDELAVEVRPGAERAALDRIADWVEERRDRNVEPTVSVTGHVGMAETEFEAALAEASGDVRPDNRTAGVERVLGDQLFRAFESKLEERDVDDDALEAEVWERTVRIFSALSTGGRLP